MRKKFTLFIALMFGAMLAQATYVPIALTGFNTDVVANGVGAPNTSSNAALDDASATTGYVFCAEDYNYNGTCTPLSTSIPPYYLPNGGLLTSTITSGLTFQLADYSSNNNLRLLAGANTGTVNFVTPTAAGQVFLLITSGAGESNINVTVTFTDASTQTFNGLTVYDWYTTNAAVIKAARVSRTKTTCGNDGTPATDNGPKLYQMALNIDFANLTKSIASVTITRTNTSTTYVNLMGISINTPCAAPVDQASGLVLTPTSSQVSGTFTAAASAPSGYLVVRYPSGATPVNPAGGTTYTTGAALGTGTVVYSGTSTSFTAPGLFANLGYDFYVYTYNNTSCGGGPVYNLTTPLMGSVTTLACGGPANTTLTVGSGFGYNTLTDAINSLAATGISGPVVLELQSNYTSASEPAFPIVFPANACISSLNNLTIRPAAGAVGLSISGSNAGPTIDFNGASNIIIDGRPGGVTGNAADYLKIINTNTGGAAIRLYNDASNNTIEYCDLQGANTSATVSGLCGVIYVGSAGTNGIGNDNNTITNCNIHGATGLNPAFGIAMYGTTTTAGSYNDNGTISNCNIYDYFHASNQNMGIKLDQGNSAWTITGNSFYQTASRVYSGSQPVRAMHINSNGSGSSTMTPQGSGFTITNNIIGGSAAGGSGTMAMSGSSNTVTHTYTGMDISVGVGAATVIANNTIANITLSTGLNTSAGVPFLGINLNYGNCVASSNTIGDPAATASIAITKTNGTTIPTSMGLRIAGGISNTVTGNTIAGISALGLATTNPMNITGIHVSNGTTNLIAGNTIGSTSVANSINNSATTGTGTQLITGINVAGGTTNNVTGNTIANLNNQSVSSNASTRGIIASSSTATVTGNNIHHLFSSSTSTGAGGSSSVVGISMTSTSGAYNVAGNTIYNLKNTTASANVNLVGIFSNGTVSGNKLDGNFIYALNTTSTGTGVVISGMDIGGGPLNVVNNMISLGLDENAVDITTPICFRGITKGTSTACNFYYNSVYIGGAGVATTATVHSMAFQRNNNGGADNILNNIFYNARSNSAAGASKHYAINFATNTLTGGNITGVNLNNNIYFTSGTGGVMAYTTTDVPAFAQNWIAGDVASYFVDPVFVNPNAGGGGSSVPDLHINSSAPSYAESGGTAVTNFTTDFDGEARFGATGYTGTGTATDIGADEFGGTPAILPCSGNPVAGTIAGPTSVCASTTFTLFLSGYTLGPGISISWESSPAGMGSWTPISGATNSSLTVTGGITSAMDYQAVVTCANGGGADMTVPATLNITPFTQCYCIPATTNTSRYINNFSTTAGIANISNLNSGLSTGGYGNFTATQTVSVLSNGSFNFSGSLTGGTFGVKVWVDWNHNGSFADAGEEMFATTGYVSSFSGTVAVPAGALDGITTMRVGADWNTQTGPANPCASFTSGEYEDYALEVIPVIACSGTPNSGTASGPGAVCASTTFTLTATGVTTGTGLTYQWESSPMGMATWTPIANATNASYTVTGGITAETDYQLVVTCTNSGALAASNTVSVGLSSFLTCYCTPASGCVNEGIENVTMGTLNNNSTFCTNASGYTSYTSLGSLVTVTQAQIIPISVTGHINSNPASVGVWIDYDHSGTFDAAEYTLVGTTNGIATLPSTQIYTTNVVIPANAQTGTTRMRVRQANQGGITATSACTNTGVYGEYEDYLIDIVAGTPCAGTPAAGTVTAPANICSNVAFTISTTGTTNGVTGLSYQWESSPAGSGTWTAIANATSLSYTETAGITANTEYRMNITCANGGGTDVTPSVTVVVNPPTQCYCTPSGSSTTYGINSFSTTGGSININNLNSGTSTAGYGNFTSQVLNASPNDVINVSIAAMGSGTYGFAVFIDYNQNGSFSDAGEVVFNTTAYANSANGSFTIPSSALTGSTGMRVVANFYNNNPSGDYCATGITGEFEDYTLNIGAPPTCLAPAGLNATAIGATYATINWTASTSNPSVGYEYIYSATNTPPAAGVSGTPVGPTVTSVNLPGLPPSTTHYYWVRSDCGGGDYSAWASASFQTLMANDLPDGAITLTVNATCTGSIYTNVGATLSTNEPRIACRGTQTAGSYVWFKFVAPASGMVKVTTDISGNNLTDTRMGLFGTNNPSNPSDLLGYYIIGCDDDNGNTVANSSTLYASGLTGGETYYVAVDQWNAASTGTFCVEVHEVTSTMIAPAGSCAASTQTPTYNEDYTGWTSLTDDQGRLIANVKRTTAGASSSTNYQFTPSLNVNTGAVRTINGQPYLDRNYQITTTTPAGATSYDVRFFFLTQELTNLQTVDANATLGNINVTHQVGNTCQSAFNPATGANSILMQSASGSANGVAWVQVNTPGFSNFFLHTGASPLVIELTDISATNIGSRNRVDWRTATEGQGDYFELERSTDGRNFAKIAYIPAKGAASNYSYLDEQAVAGVNYYRLKLVDVSGRFSYSAIVSATVNARDGFYVEAFPNPVHDVLNVKVNGTINGKATISIIDAVGKVINVYELQQGSAEVNVNKLPAGVYMVKYSDDNRTQTIRVNKM